MGAAPDPPRAVRALIVDDEPDLRLLLRTMLDLDQRIEVAGEAGDGGEALERYAELSPDVVLLDLRMPVLDGFEVAARILRDRPDQAIILFTAFLDDSIQQQALALGVRSVVGKGQIDSLAAEIVRVAA